MYRSAIVNEIGHVMFWCDDLRREQIECILNGHLEWFVKCVEFQKARYCYENQKDGGTKNFIINKDYYTENELLSMARKK